MANVKRGRGGSAPASSTHLLQALDQVLALESPADSSLRRFFKAHPELGRGDRALIAETVFDVLRHRRLYAHFAQAGGGPLSLRLAWLSWVRRGLFSPPDAAGRPGARVGGRLPSPLPGDWAWLSRVLSTDREALAPAVALSLPDWVAESLAARFGAEEAGLLAKALLEPAPLQLRANTLKTRADALVGRLGAEGIDAKLFPSVPGALEVQGHPALERSSAFADGEFEVQDAGSQLLTLLVGARRGQTVIDLCAGAGGKTLGLAATMHSLGQIFACDVSLARLQRLRPRLVRSGASNVQPFAIDSLSDPKLKRLAGRADAVLVDAPCTGLGTLRRNPDLKWRMSPADLQRLLVEQRAILEVAAGLVRPGGVLVYATCSLLAEENEAQAAHFEAIHPDFSREDAASILAAAGASLPPDAFREQALTVLPHRHGTDGFFGIRWRRSGNPRKKGAVGGT